MSRYDLTDFEWSAIEQPVLPRTSRVAQAPDRAAGNCSEHPQPRRQEMERLLHFGKTLYKDRNPVERFFNKIRFFRGIATRYDKLGSTYLAMVNLAAIRVWLRFNESAA